MILKTILLEVAFNNSFAIVLKNLGATENREDYIDRALIEYAAASYHFERAGHIRHQACVENNLAMLFWKAEKFNDAHEHLDRAQVLFTRLKDSVHLAQVDETRARVLLGEGRVIDAERVSRRAVRTLEQGDEQSLLAEALTTQGTALARLRDLDRAEAMLQRASKIAEQAGDSGSAGQAALVMLEELGAYLSNDSLKIAVNRAAELLRDVREISTLKRLIISAGRAVSVLHANPGLAPSVDWTNFSLERELFRQEGHFIKLALKDSGGRVTRAAHLLGLSGHQSLQFILNSRHRTLLSDRTPIVPRKRSFTNTNEQNGAPVSLCENNARTIRILLVEDNQTVAGVVKETLEDEGWQVEVCAERAEALERITSDALYDLLLLDYDVPGLYSIDLWQQARTLAHRREIPVIVLSGSAVKEAVMRSGANAFLRKPEDISLVVDTISELLGSSKN